MFFLDKLSYFLVTRGKSIVSYLKKFTSPRYVIAFVIIYPHIYTNILTVINAAQAALVNLADQFYSWIEATFWGVYNFMREKLQGIWFGDQIAFILAGIVMALPFLMYIIFKYAFIPIATTLLTISLNILGAVFYIFCKVVIPALKLAYGAYLFSRFMPASYKYVAKALDRFAQGRFGGFLGALFGAVAPFTGFFIGPLIISIVTDPACASAYAPPTIANPYLVPYVTPTLYQYTAAPTMSWIVASLYDQYILPQPITTSLINASASWDIRSLITYSYIMAYLGAGGYHGPYYPGAYLSPTPALSWIHPYLSYFVYSGYFLYSISYIYAELLYSLLPATYSYIFAEAPIFSISIFDTSLLAGPAYVYTYIEDFSYLTGPPEVRAYLQDFSYVALPPSVSVQIQDLSNLVYWV
jgi:hypothetical protein